MIKVSSLKKAYNQILSNNDDSPSIRIISNYMSNIYNLNDEYKIEAESISDEIDKSIKKEASIFDSDIGKLKFYITCEELKLEFFNLMK